MEDNTNDPREPGELTRVPAGEVTAEQGSLGSEVARDRDSDRQFRELNEMLERSNRDLDDFAYVVSHDLKEPLRGIGNYSTFLLEDYASEIDEEGQAKLRALVSLTSHMGNLIDALLHYSRVGRAELTIADIDLQEILEDVLGSLQFSLEESSVEVRIPRSLPTIRCDSARVSEIFRNLITNALKYNDKPEPWIEIGFGEQENATCFFWVRDNGIGIREKHLDAVFKMFRRLHARHKFGGGTGAGLSIVAKIVSRHRGRIWVESIFGEGSTFFFTLGPETAPEKLGD